MNKIFQSLIIVLVVSFSLSTFMVPYAEATEDSWATKEPMPTARSGLGVAVVNGKIYVIGGWGHIGDLNTTLEYDPATDTWATKKPMPTARRDFGIAVCQNKIYVIGGQVGGQDPTDVNEVYDPLTDTWETKTSMPTPRKYLDANAVNGKIYMIGGCQYVPHSDNLDVNEVYDPATDSWTTKTPIPTGVMGYASAVVDNKIYVIEGFNSSLNQIYDPETDTWSFGKPSPAALNSAAAGATTGVMAPKKIYVIGGYTVPGVHASSLVRVYDPEGDVWTTGTPMPTPRYSLGVAVVNDVLYAIGGGTGWLTPSTAQNEQYTPFGFGTVPPPDTTPPTISVVSPENKTYTVNNVSLTFTVSEPTSWIGYSLDGQTNVTITGNTTLTGLPAGSHSLTVYAKDIAGNSGASEIFCFSIKTKKAEQFPTWIVGAIVIVAVVGAALLVYFAKVKKKTGKAE